MGQWAWRHPEAKATVQVTSSTNPARSPLKNPWMPSTPSPTLQAAPKAEPAAPQTTRALIPVDKSQVPGSDTNVKPLTTQLVTQVAGEVKVRPPCLKQQNENEKPSS